MFDLFRFMMLRSPEKVDPSTTISIDGKTDFTNKLVDLSKGEAPRVAMKQAAEVFARSADFVADPSSLTHSQQYGALSAHLFQTRPPDLETLQSLIKKTFKLDAKAVAVERGFLNDKRRIHDSLIALQFSPAAQTAADDSLIQLCRVIDLIERVGHDDPSLNERGGIVRSLNRFIVLPANLFPLPSALVRQSPPPPDDTKTKAEQARQELLNRIDALKETIQAVNALPFAEQSQPSPGHPGSAPVVKKLGAPTAPRSAAPLTESAADLQGVNRSAVAGGDRLALHALSPSAKSVLASLKLDLVTTSLLVAAERLNAELVNATDLLFNQGPVGQIVQPYLYNFYEDPTPQEWWDGPPAVLLNPPNTHGQVAPAGIADLLVVREHVVSYEPGEIAFIENVAKGETFKRQTQRRDTTETSTLTTTTSGSETQRDLQSTDRFSLQRQSQSVVQQNTDRVPGVGSSDAYGPLVDSGGSSTQTSSQASNYGQDITRRAVSTLTESLQTQVLQRSTTEFAESAEHNYDNTKGGPDQIVVYQWLDKISEAEVFSYGKRVIYDFIVPEPAAFLINALTKWQPELTKLQKPTLFNIEPHKLNRLNYQFYAAGYGATDVQPPPEPQITIAKTYGNRAPDPFANDGAQLLNEVGLKEPVNIDGGYKAIAAVMTVAWFGGAPNFIMDVVIGQRFFVLTSSDGFPFTTDLNGEVEQIPVTVSVRNAGVYAVDLEIICEPTERLIAEWQIKTHDTILQASRDRLAEYEARLNNLKGALRVQTAGKTPDQKQAMVKAELEKECISILSNQHFDTLNAIEFSSFKNDAVPQLFLPNVAPVGRYIRFFQQAFEWDQMMYRYYPYFWGRKKYWNDRLQLNDEDSQFAAFLNAGAARVTLPVRKGYEGAVATFLNGSDKLPAGTIPSEAELLAVTTGLYVPLFAEILGDDAGPDTARPYGNPPVKWEIRLPTTLVKIRTDDKLPKWEQTTDSDGRVTYKPIAGDSVNP
jgi:hypothetical protein